MLIAINNPTFGTKNIASDTETQENMRLETEAFEGKGVNTKSRVAQKRIVLANAPLPTTESWIGGDDRERIYDTDLSPWRMICSLAITAPNGHFMGTGWLAGPRTIITAGHCIFHSLMGGWASKIVVAPGRDDTDYPFSKFPSTRFSVLEKWGKDQLPDFDIGCIHLDQDIGETLGWFGMASLPNSELNQKRINVAGYPSDKDSGRFLLHHQDLIVDVQDRRIYYTVDTFGGQSGAPAWIQNSIDGAPMVVGVHAYGVGGTTTPNLNANSAPRLIPEVIDIIKLWINEAKPT
ncbi:MAG: trypsin-like serine protease [Verrucomicrobiales bacterium]|nr:trypsin-like serine protease [Verrucomicrobiales bacterium]